MRNISVIAKAHSAIVAISASGRTEKFCGKFFPAKIAKLIRINIHVANAVSYSTGIFMAFIAPSVFIFVDNTIIIIQDSFAIFASAVFFRTD
jgi:hypothetical protein